MPSLLDLLNGDPNFYYYYGGQGHFSGHDVPPIKDRPGGGVSGQPYVYRQMGEPWSPSNFDDGFIRLGAVGAVERSTADLIRITKFFLDPPKGPLFLAKQIGLQLSNPRLESRADDFTSQGGNIFQQIREVPKRLIQNVGTTRLYNLGANTLAQVGGVEFGSHFYRHGLVPTMEAIDKYYQIVTDNNFTAGNSLSSDSTNRLLRLGGTLLNSDNVEISSYTGGPGSVYGIGRTTINRYVDTIGDASTINQRHDPIIPLTMIDLAKIGRDGILLAKPNPRSTTVPSNAVNDPVGGSTTSYDTRNMDFRQLKNALYNTNLPASDYGRFNIQTRIGRGNPGRVGLDRSKYSNDLDGTKDLINKLSLFYSDAPPQNNSSIVDLNSGEVVTPDSVRDIIKFRIEAIDHDNPRFSVWMVFRAFLQGFSDSFDAEWNPYKYTGRGESFYVYNGYVRQFSLGFMIAAQSRQEMKPLYQKLNYLMSQMAPDYNSNNKMRGPIVKLTVGDWLYRQPGIITSLGIDVDTEYPWEIALDSPEGGDDVTMHEVPMMMRVTMQFIPIQDFLPRKGASTPFISVTDRKSPMNTPNIPAQNNWLSDNGLTKANDGTPKYVLMSDKIDSARKASLKTTQ